MRFKGQAETGFAAIGARFRESFRGRRSARSQVPRSLWARPCATGGSRCARVVSVAVRASRLERPNMTQLFCPACRSRTGNTAGRSLRDITNRPTRPRTMLCAARAVAVGGCSYVAGASCTEHAVPVTSRAAKVFHRSAFRTSPFFSIPHGSAHSGASFPGEARRRITPNRCDLRAGFQHRKHPLPCSPSRKHPERAVFPVHDNLRR